MKGVDSAGGTSTVDRWKKEQRKTRHQALADGSVSASNQSALSVLSVRSFFGQFGLFSGLGAQGAVNQSLSFSLLAGSGHLVQPASSMVRCRRRPLAYSASCLYSILSCWYCSLLTGSIKSTEGIAYTSRSQLGTTDNFSFLRSIWNSTWSYLWYS